MEQCRACTTSYAAGVEACPHCGSTERVSDDTAVQMPLQITVACDRRICPNLGVDRRVTLRQVALGVVDVPRLACAGCGCELAMSWPPPEEKNVPKNTVHGGPTNAAADLEAANAAAEKAHKSLTKARAQADKDLGELTIDGKAEPPEHLTADGHTALTADMTVVQLREECKRRGLPTSGTKAELQQRLDDNPEGEE